MYTEPWLDESSIIPTTQQIEKKVEKPHFAKHILAFSMVAVVSTVSLALLAQVYYPITVQDYLDKTYTQYVYVSKLVSDINPKLNELIIGTDLTGGDLEGKDQVFASDTLDLSQYDKLQANIAKLEDEMVNIKDNGQLLDEANPLSIELNIFFSDFTNFVTNFSTTVDTIKERDNLVKEIWKLFDDAQFFDVQKLSDFESTLNKIESNLQVIEDRKNNLKSPNTSDQEILNIASSLDELIQKDLESAKEILGLLRTLKQTIDSGNQGQIEAKFIETNKKLDEILKRDYPELQHEIYKNIYNKQRELLNKYSDLQKQNAQIDFAFAELKKVLYKDE